MHDVKGSADMSGTLASWTVIGDAAAGRRKALAEIVQRGTDADDAALATLLLLIVNVL